MKQFLRAAGFMGIAVVAQACAATGTLDRVTMPTNVERPFVAGYHAYWTGDAWLDYPLDLLDELYVFELEAAGDGTILDAHGWPELWRPMIAAASTAGVQVVPVVSMHDPDAFEALFADANRSGRLVDTILAILGPSPALAGVHLDVEVFRPVSPRARDGYTAFVARLGNAMRALDPRLSLSVFVLAFDDDDVYNEAALGQIADFLIVQGYDYHSMASENAGPVSALRGWGRLNWEHVVQRFDAFGVARDKIVMSVPLYGYEWPVESADRGARTASAGVTVPYAAGDDVLPEAPRARARADEYGIHRDPSSGSPFYVFETPEGWRQGWFEDAESLRMKYDFVRAEGLGGVALFPLGYGDSSVWAGLRGAFGETR